MGRWVSSGCPAQAAGHLEGGQKRHDAFAPPSGKPLGGTWYPALRLPRITRGALSLGPCGGLEFGLEPAWLLRCAVSSHLFAESPMGFHRSLAFNQPPFRALEGPSAF